jgi:transposase-like protein
VIKIAGVTHWLWRAVDQTGIVLDVLVQRRRDKQAAKRLLRFYLTAYVILAGAELNAEIERQTALAKRDPAQPNPLDKVIGGGAVRDRSGEFG